jgi:hypothetical protein
MTVRTPCRRGWFAKHDRVSKPIVIILICSLVWAGCSATGVPSEQSESSSAARQFVSRSFIMELISMEMLDDGVTLTFLYTNRWSQPQGAYPDMLQTFLIDDRGNRYQVRQGPAQRNFAPQIQQRIQMTFAKVRPDASWVSFFSFWKVGSGAPGTDARVEMRRIALPKAF